MKRPVEGAYIAHARRALTASRLEAKAHDDLMLAKRACASALHNVGVKGFDFVVNNIKYHAQLEKPWGQRIHTRKLYTLLASGEISIDQFLDCVVAPIKAVEETLGESVAKSLLEDYRKGLDLIIEEV